MIIKARFKDTVESQLVANGVVKPSFKVWGIYDMEHWRRQRHGALYSWDMLDRSITHNVCTAEGLDGILNIMFHGATQITTWYCLVFETDTTPSDTTTYAVPVFTECQAYAEATRPEYVEAAASSKSITNSANKAVFTFNASKTIYGAALVGGGTDASTKADVAGGGKMFNASKFSSSRSVVSADVINLTITLTTADT